MLAKLFFLIAVILFVLAALVTNSTVHFLEWGLASTAAGLLVEGYGPVTPTRLSR